MFEEMPWMVDGRKKTLDLSNDWKRPFSSHPFLFERGGTKSVWYGSGFATRVANRSRFKALQNR